jgi:hypothetical protein
MKGTVSHDDIQVVSLKTLSLASLSFSDPDGIEFTANNITITVDPIAMVIGGRKISAINVEDVVFSIGDADKPFEPVKFAGRFMSKLVTPSKSDARKTATAPTAAKGMTLIPDVIINNIRGDIVSRYFNGQVTEGRATVAPISGSMDAVSRLLTMQLEIIENGSQESSRLRIEADMPQPGKFTRLTADVSPALSKVIKGQNIGIRGLAWKPGEVRVTGLTAELKNSSLLSGNISAEDLMIRWVPAGEGHEPVSAVLPEELRRHIPSALKPFVDTLSITEVRLNRPVLDVVGVKHPPEQTQMPVQPAESIPLNKRVSQQFKTVLETIEGVRTRLTSAAAAYPGTRLGVTGATIRYLMPGESAPRAGYSLSNADIVIERADNGEMTSRIRFECPEVESKSNELSMRVATDGTLYFEIRAANLPLQPYRLVMPQWFETTEETALKNTDLKLKISPGPVLEISGSASAGPATVFVPEISTAKLPGLHLGLSGQVVMDSKNGKLSCQDAIFSLGAIQIPFTFTGTGMNDVPVLAVDARIERIKASDLLESIPKEAVPVLAGVQLDGTFAAKMTLSINTKDVSSLDFDFNPDVSDLVTLNLGDAVNLELLRSTFLHRIEEADRVVTRMIGVESPGWVPIETVPGYLISALTTSEDARFFTHHGFSKAGIQRSLKVNLEKGGFFQGASTLSQQLVKNLFLSREKTMARKIQEAFITWQVERNLAKEKILELYLNVIEWGPEVWGLKEAANHYFAKEPSNLTLLEASWLVLIIPSPVRHHQQFEEGRVPPAFMVRVKKLIETLKSTGAVSEGEAAVAAEQTIRFVTADRNAEPVPDSEFAD